MRSPSSNGRTLTLRFLRRGPPNSLSARGSQRAGALPQPNQSREHNFALAGYPAGGSHEDTPSARDRGDSDQPYRPGLGQGTAGSLTWPRSIPIANESAGPVPPTKIAKRPRNHS